MKRFNFNLVEIMLAIVVLSVGMASVFVLFPAGLSNHKTAMAENSFADLAEFIVSHIRSQAALGSNEIKFTYSLGTTAEGKDIIYELDVDDAWDKVDDTGTLLVNKTSKNIYLVRQLSGPASDRYTDFAAIARVYIDDTLGTSGNNDIFVPSGKGDMDTYSSMTKSASGSDDGDIRELALDTFLMPLVVEISYPADLPYDDREKAYFRFEIFNESYEQRVKL